MSRTAALAVVSLSLIVPGMARAHCDTLDGPVVATARRALETGRLNPVLAWVRPADVAEVRAAFARATAVRKGGPEARELADTWFFETVVRVHRAGEGAPYTGLKAASRDAGPAIAAADQAIEKGSPEGVERLLLHAVKEGHHERFARLRALRPPGDDVTAGRAWVEAYVPYVHYVESVYEAAQGRAGAHAEPEAAAHGAPGPAHEHGGAR